MTIAPYVVRRKRRFAKDPRDRSKHYLYIPAWVDACIRLYGSTCAPSLKRCKRSVVARRAVLVLAAAEAST